MDQAYQPFFQLDGMLESGLLIVCDHANNTLPKSYGSLGLPSEAFSRHIAYDIGVDGVVRGLAERLGCPAVLSNFSRLLIDPNRAEYDPTLIMRLSDGQIVQGNHPISEVEKQKRLVEFHQPYHGAIAQQIDRFVAAGITPAIFSVHSFTPAWKGVARPWHVAMLADVDTGFHGEMLRSLSAPGKWVVGDNQPYDGALKGDCMHTHGIRRGLQHALIELRQDLIADVKGETEWADALAPMLERFVSDRKKTERRYFSSRTGPYIREDGLEQL